MDGLLLPEAPAWLGRLGWSLLHFLWQGALVGLLYAITLPLMRAASAQARYLASLAFLFILACCPPVTFLMLGDTVPEPARPVGLGVTMQSVIGTQWPAAGGSGDLIAMLLGWLGVLAPWIVPAWAAGVALLSVRLFRDGFSVRAIVADADPVTGDHWARLLARVSRTVGLTRPVRLLESLAIEVPVVVGWLRPVVLVPSSVLLGLDPRQLELILVHELAHVRRGDYVINLLQVAVETLLFYHPVVGLISARVRQERENCCDDLVVQASGDRLAYARALLELDGLRGLAASAVVGSNGGNLAIRIRRIIGMPTPQRGAADWIAGITLTAVGAATLSVGHIEEPAAPVVATVSLTVDTDAPGAAPAVEPPSPTAAGAGPDLRATEPGTGDSAGISASEVDGPAQAVATTATFGGTPRAAAGSPPALPERSPRPAEATAAARPAPDLDPEEPPVVHPAPASAGTAIEPLIEEFEPVLEPLALDVATTAAATVPAATVEAAGRGPVLEGAGSAAVAEPEPVVTGGRPLRVVAPEFPAHARHDGHQGYVVVAFTISRNGRPRDIEVVDVGPRDYFSKAAVRAIREWRFEPVRVDGQLVEKRMTQRFKFVLDGSDPIDPDECVLLTGSRLCR